jgi:tRNA(adenine34) deaminase
VNRRELLSRASGVAAGALLAPGMMIITAKAQTPTAARPEDERFMRLAIDEARKGDYPFGAVIVDDGAVLATGFNSGKRDGDPTAHGEMVAIRSFLSAHGAEALRGTTLYTSGEPCAMCTGAILWSGIARLVFAASVEQLGTKIDQIMISSAAIAATAPFAPLAITGGVLSAEAMALFP